MKKYIPVIVFVLIGFGIVVFYYYSNLQKANKRKSQINYIITVQCSSVPISNVDEAVNIIASFDSSRFENGKLNYEDSVSLKSQLDAELKAIGLVKLKLDSLVEIDTLSKFKQRALQQIELCEKFITNYCYSALSDMRTARKFKSDLVEKLNKKRDVITRYMSEFSKVQEDWMAAKKIEWNELRKYPHRCR